jgi:hypothetical protein
MFDNGQPAFGVDRCVVGELYYGLKGADCETIEEPQIAGSARHLRDVDWLKGAS